MTMSAEETNELLFSITKEIKHFYESPVIFLTGKDYSSALFEAMCAVRTALVENSSKNNIVDTIVDLHLNWLHAVNEIENFKKGFDIVNKKENLYELISFTIDSLCIRLKRFQNYLEINCKKLPNAEVHNALAELEIVEDMHKDLTKKILEQLKCFRACSPEELQFKFNFEVEELLNWLDKINDSVIYCLSKSLHLHVPQLSGDLTKTLRQIVDELQVSKTPSALKLLEELKLKGRELTTMIRCTADHDLEIHKVIEKINVLDSRINRLETEQSSAVMALQRKKEYLEKRLLSLENLKTSLKTFHDDHNVSMEYVDEEELCSCEDFYQFRIFNHLLPAAERERLVTELCNLWNLAIMGSRSKKSLISILSAAEMREEYTDELGTYYIDEHSRKIYKFSEDDTLYQINELDELVPLSDDGEHVYFYDQCGRYFVDTKTRERVYKAHATASEFMMDSSGVLLKIKEVRDGITYYYDSYGRYYIDNTGKHIYREADSVSEYENDGLGNLVRIRSHLDIFDPCPDDAHVTDDCKYLKKAVGLALTKCIGEVILHQPADPIKYLSDSLLKYRENIEWREKRSVELEQFNVEREIVQAELRAAAERADLEAALQAQGGSEASYDSNLVHYLPIRPGDISTSASTK